MTEALDRLLHEATSDHRIPGVAAGVFTSEGVRYEGARGARSLDGGDPMEVDTVATIMSMTKPIAGIACMQAVEEGLLELDQPAGEILPWLSEVPVLDGFDGDGQPILRPARTPVTLRRLLTHTSGFVYDIWNENQARYQRHTGSRAVGEGTREGYHQPLAFDPGERWEYGIGIDWATMMLEEATGETLADRLRRRIFEPLGMTDTAFRLTDAQRARVASVHTRDDKGRFRTARNQPWASQRDFDGGGGGLFSTVHDYGRFVRMLLNGGTLDGERIVSPCTLAEASRNNMGSLRVTPLPTTSPRMSAPAEFFPGVHKTWGLSFQINEQPTPTGRSAGGLSWAGLYNSFFWVDPAKDVAGVFLTQTLPFVDPVVLGAFEDFERLVYDDLGR